jgi:hypothetical protein
VSRLSRWLPLIAAAAAVVVRVPFLLRSDAFFNSDEALEGLMARHLGELPIFFWGQGYKGVPEVYLSALAFAIFGVGVVQLKAVTLAIWTAAVAASTRLGQRWYGDTGGIIAGALLVIGPTSVIYWSLSASAEVAWLTLIFAVVLLAYQRSVDDPARPVPPVVMTGCGAALWVHPIAVSFVGGLALNAALRSRWWRQRRSAGLIDLVTVRHLRGPARIAILALHLMVVFVLATFLWTYFGFTLSAGFVTAAHPQKVFRTLTIVVAIAVMAHALAGVVVDRRRVVAAAGWFALGLVPVALYMARGGAPGSVISVHPLADAPALIGTFATEALPMMLGIRAPDVGRIAPWWLAAPFVVLLVIHLVATSRDWLALSRTPPEPSRVVAVFTAMCLVLMLGPGGAFNDIHSYRYLMPFFGLMALSAASAVVAVAARSRAAAALIAAACVASFAVMDVRWFAALHVDGSDREIVKCLEEQGIRAATADYWIAYRLTFLADEAVVVNPTENARYTPYADTVQSASRRAWIQFADGRTPDRKAGAVVCRSQTLEALAQQ